MKIFKISHNKKGYDMYKGFIVVAKEESVARNIAKNNSADEGGLIWLMEADVVEVGNYTGIETTPFVLLSDFNAG